jgi:hypothetical protein
LLVFSSMFVKDTAYGMTRRCPAGEYVIRVRMV